MSVREFCLKWNNHQSNFISVFRHMLKNEVLVDVTLIAEEKELHAHKIILSACSIYFENLFATCPKKHAIVIMKDVKYDDLKILVNFMYYGEVNITEAQLPDILDTAKLLKIKGLTDIPDSNLLNKPPVLKSDEADFLISAESSRESNTRQQSISPSHLPPSTHHNGSSIEKTADACADTNVIRPFQQNIRNVSDESSSDNVNGGRNNLAPVNDHHTVEKFSIPHQGYWWPKIENLETGNENVNDQEGDFPTNLPAIMSHLAYQAHIPMQGHHSSTFPPGYLNASLKPPAPLKRRRRSNPQLENNFQRALEAVRSGGIGFCRAARMFGVNNRTLWLEYKKRGYPNSRPSNKNRPSNKQERAMMYRPPPNVKEEAILQEQHLTL